MRLEDGGFRRHSRTPLVEPSIVREIPHAMGVTLLKKGWCMHPHSGL